MGAAAARVTRTGPGMSAPQDEAGQIEALVVQAAAGHEQAWQQLWAAIEPKLARLVAQPRFLGRVSQHEDDQHNIIVDIMARLREDGFHRLHLYLSAHTENPKLAFFTWLRVVAKRVGIDYMRAHPDYVDRRRSTEPVSSPGKWVTPETLPPMSQLPGERPPITTRGTAAELLRHADAALPETQRRALELWIQSEDHTEIARRLHLTGAAEAERLVRSAIERLRRHFRTSG
jgi:DNA-directed RNA polymerase specialized sigma24 family protein